MSDVIQAKTTTSTGRIVGVDVSAMESLVSSLKDRREPVAPARPVSVKSIQVSVDTFIAYADNPKQRDTERHAAMAIRHHLKASSPAQARVAAALYNGTYFKIDGHTRAYLWERGQLARPNAVNVDLYECSTLQQVIELYDTFDNSKAAETAADRLSGALKLVGIEVRSSYFKNYGFNTIFTMFSRRWNTKANLPLYLDLYRNEIIKLDGLNLNKKIFKSGVLAGAILLIAKYGDAIVPFFDALNNNRGVKAEGECDAVQALYELIMVGQYNGGWSDLSTLTQKTLSCGERWMAGQMYKTTRGGATVKETMIGPYLKKVP